MTRKSFPVLRALAYILRSLIVIASVVLFCWLCYSEAKQISSLVVVTTEGMTERADNIINYGNPDKYDPDALSEYFISEAIINDELFKQELYQDYIIGNYDYSLKIESVHVWPWGHNATVKIREIVSLIEGRLDDSLLEEENELTRTPPQWDEKNYELTMVKTTEGRWYIGRLTEIEDERELEQN